MEPIIPETPFATSAQDIAAQLVTHVEHGLSAEEATRRTARFGPNRLPEAEVQAWPWRLLAQLNQLVVWILIAAAIIAGVAGDVLDTLAILAIVLQIGRAHV